MKLLELMGIYFIIYSVYKIAKRRVIYLRIRKLEDEVFKEAFSYGLMYSDEPKE